MKCFLNQANKGGQARRLGFSTERDYILGGHFSDHCGPVHILSMSRFLPADHHDCILASEIITTTTTTNRAVPSQSPAISLINGRAVTVSTSVGASGSSFVSGDEQIEANRSTTSSTLFGWACNATTIASSMSPHHRKVLSLFVSVVCLAAFALISTSLFDAVGDAGGHRTLNSVDDLSSSGSHTDGIATSFDSKLQPIQLDEIFQNQLAANYFNGTWATDAKLAFYDLEYNLLTFDVRTGVVSKLIPFQHVLIDNLKGLELSKDLRYLLTPSETIELFRHSKLERLRIYDIVNKRFLNLFPTSNTFYFQFGLFGPRDSQLVFVYNNDIYYKDSAAGEAIRLTTSGLNGVVYNGHGDWLYEEEILDTNRALWFSPNGTYLAYLQINDTGVDIASWNRYGDYYNLTNNQYPVMEMLRYPKPGTNNPQVTLFVVNLNKNVDKIRINKLYPPETMAMV